ncbi:3-hydroxyacyl-CoA dehydrogenase NAD-binding domain-containing protein [Bordetella sp. FB-8]|uniref:3-hydroxyacyl-CoA dehydrogenase NAD-binding domain-containing protein n=1 Tax=Bordetella sp. FB-8 TaxID=1159870 RepID=UPI000364B40B|nr:3-hydroxyacyl-CoA dehydrogenase NAD-binding domain-containing protein [Bordetella sp. FB-8]
MNGAPIAAFGTGRMGRGIAAAHALAGQDFALIDLRPRTAQAWQRLQDQARAELQGMFDTMLSLGCIDPTAAQAAPGRVTLVGRDDAPAALASACLLFEAVPETLDAKREALEFVGRHTATGAIVASTSSTMLAGELSALIPHPERFLNTHWLNPAYLIPLVEVAPHAGTSACVLERALAALKTARKIPVVCNDRPGYIVPRLQTLVMNEAARMIEEGTATAADIDQAIRYGFGPRYAAMGVAEFIDFGGLDILYHASRYLSAHLDPVRYAAPRIIEEKMQAGELGVKTGQGLYTWEAGKVQRFQQDALARMARILALNTQEHAAQRK